MVINGCKITHATPITVCLYRTLMSRHTKKYSSSRYSQSSRCRSSSSPRGGAMCTIAGAAAGCANAAAATTALPAEDGGVVIVAINLSDEIFGPTRNLEMSWEIYVQTNRPAQTANESKRQCVVLCATTFSRFNMGKHAAIFACICSMSRCSIWRIMFDR